MKKPLGTLLSRWRNARCLSWPMERALQQTNFTGKTIRVTVGLSAGGGYDTYARAVARHMGKHIPGNPDVGCRQHGRRRKPDRGQLHLQ